MPDTRFAPLADVSAAQWLVERITGFQGRVRDVVPGDFAAFARVLHRPDQGLADTATPATWAEVGARRGTVVHPAVQWGALTGGDRSGADPMEGSLDPVTLPLLRDVLAGHTTTPGSGHFGVWVGWGGLPTAWQAAPTFRLPHRDYYLFTAPLTEVVDLAVEIEVAGLEGDALPQGIAIMSAGDPSSEEEQRRAMALSLREHGAVRTPQLWWPADHAWCVASEIDFDSTIVAGAPDLVAALMAADGIEAVVVGADTSLQFDADTVNDRPR